MNLYTFYFDESFHDRKIVLNEDGKLNVLREDALENYVGVFWGCEQSCLRINSDMLYKFEEEQKKIMGLSDEQELKSTTIHKKNYKYGIRSFNKNTLEFYEKLFAIVDFINPILQINTISKVDYFVVRVFGECSLPETVNKKAFFYTLTKFIIMYHNPKLLQALYAVHDVETAKKFKNILVADLRNILELTQGVERKELERNAYMQMVQILSHMDMPIIEDKKFDFAYFVNFAGLINLLEEKSISVERVRLIIDQENNTFRNAKQYPFFQVEQNDSKKCIQLLLCDWLSGFIGQMMYGISHDVNIKENWIDENGKIDNVDVDRKRLLSEEWFDLSERQFNLYHYIYDVLLVQHQEYWTSMTLNYGDQAACFFSLFRYVAMYGNYNEFKKISCNLHTERYNSRCCEELQRHYEEMTE